MEKMTIEAVYEDDLKEMMESLGMWDEYLQGNLKCICGETITDDNLTAFQKIKGKVWPLHSLLCRND